MSGGYDLVFVFLHALFNTKRVFWYAHWNKRGMTIVCFKYCTLMVWHSKGTFYARCSRKSWSISLVFVFEWVIISLFISYFWELCDLCLRSQSTCCQPPHLIAESGSKTGHARNYYKAVCCLHQIKCLLSFFSFDMWSFSIMSNFST